MRPKTRFAYALLAGLLVAGHAVAQDRDDSGDGGGLREAVVEVGSQPARDLGMAKREAPPVLLRAAEAPYSLKGLDTCQAVGAERAALDEVLGPDIDGARPVRENRGAKLAAAGGRTLVNSIIPIRGLIREVTGAAPADRRFEALIDAGHARRGFLRGIEAKLECSILVIDVAALGGVGPVGANQD